MIRRSLLCACLLCLLLATQLPESLLLIERDSETLRHSLRLLRDAGTLRDSETRMLSEILTLTETLWETLYGETLCGETLWGDSLGDSLRGDSP